MRKFNVFNLYVLEQDGHKFICENINENSYKECLTGEKIVACGSVYSEPLKEYYSILSLRKIKNGKFYDPLMLTKKDILEKYLEINSLLNLEQNEKDDCCLAVPNGPYNFVATEEQFQAFMNHKPDPEIIENNAKVMKKIKFIK